MPQQTLHLVDTDSRRRAAIVRHLSTSDIHVEPFESVAELIRYAPQQGQVILAHDAGSTIAALMRQLVDRGTWCPTVAYHERPEVRRVVRAMQNHVTNYLSWPFSASDVSLAVNVAVAAAGSFGSRAKELAARGRIELLTERERQVLARIAGGLSNRGIAGDLQISPRTVETHRANLLHKMHARHTSDAIRVAFEGNLVV